MAEALHIFDALPGYLGGKRKLAKAIFSLVPPVQDAPVFIDAFMGGASVSLMAKALGHQVIANDIAYRSYITGKALIENGRARIGRLDVAMLCQEKQDVKRGFIEANFCPTVFTSKHARFLDDAFGIVRALEDGPRKWLLLLLLLQKAIIYIRPYGKFSSPNAFGVPVEEGRIEDVKAKTYGSSIKAVLRPIPEVLEGLRQTINGGVIDNSRKNRVYQLDVLEFLEQVTGDVAYFDPPYAGTAGYEENYHILDEVLAGRILEQKKSRFSEQDGYRLLGNVCEASKHIQTIIISMGNAGGKLDCLREVEEIVARSGRSVKSYRIKYAHLGAVASEEHKAKNQEYLIVGRANW